MLLSRTGISVQPTGKPAEARDIALCFTDRTVLLRTDGARPTLPTLGELGQALKQAGEPLEALAAQRRAYLYPVAPPAPEGFGYCPIGVFREEMEREEALMMISAFHLSEWYARNRFCGHCGAPMSPHATERALVCPACGQLVYPTISPAVAVAITDGDRILLARNANGSFRHFSLIAGYLEVGESLEQTVHREVMEEVGLRVRDVRYFASQPWGLSQTEMIGFFARLDGDDRITLQQSELAEARWFTRAELEPQSDPASLSFTMIERFRAEGDEEESR